MILDIHIDALSVRGLALSHHDRRLLGEALRRHLADDDTVRTGNRAVDAMAAAIVGRIRKEITDRTASITLNDHSRSREL